MPVDKLRPSFTFTEDRLAELRAVVPEAFADGEVNWEALREALGAYLEDEGRDAEHFGLTWPGKRQARRLAAQPSKGTLLPASGEGVDEAMTHNLFIEGDNLEVLKLLQKSYAGRVKMIYIDPPYNTGNDFVYNDDYSEPLDSYLRSTGQIDEQGQILVSNTKADGRFHSKWLSMMYPRLLLARSFLSDDGLIFITIDDNELHHLKMLMDEIFGEENFIANISWEKRYTRSNNAKMFYSLKDSILAYRKTGVVAVIKEARTDKANSIYKNPDKDERGVWTSSSYVNPATKQQRPNLVYPIRNPFTNEIIEHPTHAWKYERKEHERHIREKRLWWGLDGDAKYPRLKVFLSESEGGIVPVDLWDYKESGTTDDGGAEIKDLFGEAAFDNPKPTKLLMRMLRLVSKAGSDDIIMDFFAGAASTGDAILRLNREDGGNRRFILVQLPETTAEESTARKIGFKNIAEISKERLRRSIKRMQQETKGKLDLQDRDEPEDLGFRAYRLGHSNYKAWQDYRGDNVTDLETLFDRIETPLVDGWKSENVLTEVLLIQGFPLDSNVSREASFKLNVVQRVETEAMGYHLFVCLDSQIEDDTIERIDFASEDVFVCLDSALTDEAKLRLADRCTLRVI